MIERMRTPYSISTAAIAILCAGLVAGCGASTVGRGATGTALTAPATGTASTGTASTGAPSTGAASSATGPVSSPTVSGAYFDDPSEVATVLADARDDVATVNSYDYRHLAQARVAALAVVTPTYRTNYLAVLRSIRQAATGLRAVQRATVTKTAIGPIDGDAASALVFGQLRTISKTTPGGRVEPFVASVDLRRVGSSWLINDLSLSGTIAGDPPGTPDLVAAADAARRDVAAVLTFRRAHFDTDFARALASTTGSLRTDLQGRKGATRTALSNGKFDLAATVRALATASASGTTVAFLVQADGYKITGGRRGAATPQSLQVTVTKSSSTWLLSDLQTIGVN